jgi:transposase InsO family protein
MMELSTSSYYYRPKVSRVQRDQDDADLREKIESVQELIPDAGYRYVREDLLRQGIVVNSKRIRRVMLKYSLHAQVKKRFISTTDSDHAFNIYPNLIEGRTVTDINQVWVSDITYIRIMTGFVFLAVIMDLFSRRIIGWAISKSLDREVALSALRMAISQRKPPEGLIHHSDRGVQYASNDYVDILNENKIQISMSRSGNPYDNAFAESFMKTLKRQEVYLWEYENFLDVVERIPFFIEEVYNRKRLHSSIGYLPPEEFEEMLKDEVKRKELVQTVLISSAKKYS